MSMSFGNHVAVQHAHMCGYVEGVSCVWSGTAVCFVFIILVILTWLIKGKKPWKTAMRGNGEIVTTESVDKYKRKEYSSMKLLLVRLSASLTCSLMVECLAV